MSDRSPIADTADARRRAAGQPQPDLREQLKAAIRSAPTGRFNVTTIADAVLTKVVQPLVDAKQAEVDQLTREAAEDREALLSQPVLRHCVYPGCLREYDAIGSLCGRTTRPEWSSKGWLQVSALGGDICPDHAAVVAEDAHRPRWLATGKFLACACGWESPPVRWRGYGAEAWKDHVLTETEPT
jgi:hypothetical protein